MSPPGSYRLARRPIRQWDSDLFGLDISPGMIPKLERQAAEVLAPVVAEVAAAERALGVSATCRQQGRNVLEFLTDCFRARSGARPAPSLLV